MADLRYTDVRHDCDPPRLAQCGQRGNRYQEIARWRCSECRSRWALRAQSLNCNRFGWERVTNGSARWRRAERRRLAKETTETVDDVVREAIAAGLTVRFTATADSDRVTVEMGGDDAYVVAHYMERIEYAAGVDDKEET
jgi:hypothetical protein